MASAPTAAAVPITAPRFTVDMLDALPRTGQRYELLDGFLLVTPPPRTAHQIVIARLSTALANAVGDPGPAYVVAQGVVERGDRTHFEPDLLVYPSRFSPDAEWKAVTEWWLAVEVISPGSRVYDREVKRDAYLKLGVEVVWLVDLDARRVEVWQRGASEPLALGEGETLQWEHGPGVAPVRIEVSSLFHAFGRQPGRDEE